MGLSCYGARMKKAVLVVLAVRCGWPPLSRAVDQWFTGRYGSPEIYGPQPGLDGITPPATAAGR